MVAIGDAVVGGGSGGLGLRGGLSRGGRCSGGRLGASGGCRGGLLVCVGHQPLRVR